MKMRGPKKKKIYVHTEYCPIIPTNIVINAPFQSVFFFFFGGQYRWEQKPQLNNLSMELPLSSQLLTSKRNERTEIKGLMTLQSEWLTAKSKGNCSLQIVSNKSYVIQNFKVLGPLVKLTVMNKETEI